MLKHIKQYIKSVTWVGKMVWSSRFAIAYMALRGYENGNVKDA